MNSGFPESPEDRLLDELLHEQSHGPDEAFLQRLEAAVDAGSSPAAHQPATRSHTKLAIAAGIALAAGAAVWWRPLGHPPAAPGVAQEEHPPATLPMSVRGRIVDNRTGKNTLAPDLTETLRPAPGNALTLPGPDTLAKRDANAFGVWPSLGPLTGGGMTGGLGGTGKDEGFGSGMAAGHGAGGTQRDASPRPNTGDSDGAVVDPPWKSVQRDPLSTFPINIDTASYGNLRRMIREGRPIPPDAVRIEECINAFNYHYAGPQGDDPFAVGATVAHCPWAPAHQLVRVAIKGRGGREVFSQDPTGELVASAKDVKIQVEFNPAKVGGYRLIGYAYRMLRNEDFNNGQVDAGDIGAGHTATAFYELTPPRMSPVTDDLKYQTTPVKPAASDEWLTVKLRYKHPAGEDSRTIEFALAGEAAALAQTDADFQFATAAALFGMKLRAMDEVGRIGWDQVLALTRPGLASDTTQDRAEFVNLVRSLASQETRILAAPADVKRTPSARP